MTLIPTCFNTPPLRFSQYVENEGRREEKRDIYTPYHLLLLPTSLFFSYHHRYDCSIINVTIFITHTYLKPHYLKALSLIYIKPITPIYNPINKRLTPTETSKSTHSDSPDIFLIPPSALFTLCKEEGREKEK